MFYIYFLILILLALLLFGYIYFSSKLQKQKKFYEKKLDDCVKEKAKNNTKAIMKTEILGASSKDIKPSNKEYSESTLPYTSREPIEETENIDPADFIIFKGSRLLIVEDNFINQKILLSALKKSGIDISIVNNGQEALDLLFAKKYVFDLVLMDINMPVMDGYTATQKIREDQYFDSLPIVTFTAFNYFTRGNEIKKMFELGVNAYITKPLIIGQLYTVLNIYLGNYDRQISLLESIKVEGLDIKHGIAMADENEEGYKQSLREFILFYKSMIYTMPKWIDDKESERIMFTCTNMGDILKYIGAYELQDIVFRMKKIYIYNTEHRIEEFREIFPEKLERLIHAIDRYLLDK